MRRLLFPLLVLVLGIALSFGIADRAYDAGYVTGYEEGAVEAATAATGEPSDTSVRVISPDVDRFRGPGIGGFLFPLVFLVLFFGVFRRRRWGGRGRGGPPGSWGPPGPGHDPRQHLDRWHRAAHDDAGTDGEGSGEPVDATAWPGPGDRDEA